MVPRVRQFGGADDGDRRHRHRRHRRLLLVTVEDQLNVIWRVTSPRPWGQRVLAYWALITLGPLLVGLSLSLSTYFEIAARQAGFGQQAFQWFESGWLHGLARAVPALLEFVALTLLYWLIPNCAVRWRDAALGALIATAAIGILKVGLPSISAPCRITRPSTERCGDPDFSAVDVYFVDGGAARRGGRRRLAALADRRADRQVRPAGSSSA